MFNERSALKLRLEQMQKAEERYLQDLREERKMIYNRLKQIDGLDTKSSAFLQDISKVNTYENTVTELTNMTSQKNRKGRPSRRSKTTKMRDAAIALLREQINPIRGSQLQKLIEARTGFKIANMTTFMLTIQKTDDNIIKTGRGLYTYNTESIYEINDIINKG